MLKFQFALSLFLVFLVENSFSVERIDPSSLAVPEAAVESTVNLNFYISPTGSDTNDGLSPESPFATMPHAIEPLLPGDTPHVLHGLYTNATYGDGNYWKTTKQL